MFLIFPIVVIAGLYLFGWWMLLIIAALAILYFECYLPWEEKKSRKYQLWLKLLERRKLKFNACHLYMEAYSKKEIIKHN